MAVNVFLVDDHPLFRAGVAAALYEAEGLRVVGEACSSTAVETLRRLAAPVDVVLVDPRPAGRREPEDLRALAAGPVPQGRPRRVLVMSMSAEDEAVVAALRAGAHGYVVKWAPSEELVRALHTVADGGAIFSPSVAARLSHYFTAVHELPVQVAFPQLTGREREVLGLLARGYSNRRIARQLVVAEKTIRNHVSHIFTKLQVGDRTTAAIRARSAGLGG